MHNNFKGDLMYLSFYLKNAFNSCHLHHKTNPSIKLMDGFFLHLWALFGIVILSRVRKLLH